MNPASANRLMLKYYGLKNLIGKYLALSDITRRLLDLRRYGLVANAPVSPAGGKVRDEL